MEARNLQRELMPNKVGSEQPEQTSLRGIAEKAKRKKQHRFTDLYRSSRARNKSGSSLRLVGCINHQLFSPFSLFLVIYAIFCQSQSLILQYLADFFSGD